jgi:hypothetical protein
MAHKVKEFVPTPYNLSYGEKKCQRNYKKLCTLAQWLLCDLCAKTYSLLKIFIRQLAFDGSTGKIPRNNDCWEYSGKAVPLSWDTSLLARVSANKMAIV